MSNENGNKRPISDLLAHFPDSLTRIDEEEANRLRALLAEYSEYDPKAPPDLIIALCKSFISFAETFTSRRESPVNNLINTGIDRLRERINDIKKMDHPEKN